MNIILNRLSTILTTIRHILKASLPFWALALLLTPCYFAFLIRIGQAVRPAPTMTPPPTPPAGLAQCFSGVVPEVLADNSLTFEPAPGGRHCAVAGSWIIHILAEDGRWEALYWSKWVRFWGWTADGRFALYDRHDQYGNRQAHAFDTQNWDSFGLAAESACFGGMSGGCQLGLRAVAPNSSQALLADGQIIDLAARQTAAVLALPPGAHLWQAGWPPDGQWLAYLLYPAGGLDAPPAYLPLYLVRVGEPGPGKLLLEQAWPVGGLERPSFTWTPTGTLTLSGDEMTLSFQLPGDEKP